MTIFERIEALRGFAHDEILAIMHDIAVMAGADIAVAPTPVPSEPYALQITDAPMVEPVAEEPVVDVPVVEEVIAAPMEAPAAAAVSEPVVTVTEG